MRVLLVNDYTELGGAEVVMRSEAAGLRERGHETRVFTGTDAGLHRMPWSYVDSIGARRALRAELDAFEPDVVHLHNIYHVLSPGVLATLGRWKHRKPGRRVVMTLHDYHLLCPNAGLRRFGGLGRGEVPVERTASLIYLLASKWDHRGWAYSTMKLTQHVWNYRLLGRRGVLDAVLAPSRYMASIAERGLRGVPERTRPVVRALPNPLELGEGTAFASGMRTIGDTPESTDAFTLLFAGRVEPEKGLAPFIAHLGGVDGVRLEIVGDGSESAACLAAGRAAGVPVHAVGKLPHEATLARIAAADAVVLPSVCPENAPVTLFEALALRRPILASDAGGMREIVEDFGVGARFDPSDGDAVRAAVEHVRSERVGPEAWARVDRLLMDRTPARHAERLEGVYASL